MSVLANSRHERFAHGIVEGMSADAAYAAAGYKPNRHNAARLNTKEHIRARISELNAGAAERALVTKARVLEALARIAFADIRKAVRWQSNVTSVVRDDDGSEHLAVSNQVQIVDSADLDDDTASALAEIAQTDKGGLRVKFHDKMAALTLLAKHVGLVGDDAQPVHVHVGEFVDAPRETREEWLARKARERAERTGTPLQTGGPTA